MSKEIYHVVAILNEYSIAIDAGANHGLSKGDKIEIFEEGERITHPSTKEDLGAIIFTKDTLEIVHVDEKYSICQKITIEKIQSAVVLALEGLNKTIGSKRTVTKLNVVPEQVMNIPLELSPDEKLISIGDKARVPF